MTQEWGNALCPGFKIVRGLCGSRRHGEMHWDLAVVHVLSERFQTIKTYCTFLKDPSSFLIHLVPTHFYLTLYEAA